jgi:hypothetical protein
MNSGFGIYLNQNMLQAIRQNQGITAYATPYINLYVSPSQWYCSYSSCTMTYMNRTVYDNFSANATLILYYTPDSPPIIYGISPVTAAYGDARTLSAGAYDSRGYPLSYTWRFSNGLTAAGLNPTIDFSGPEWGAGDYTATLTATDPYGYTASLGTDIAVTPEPATMILLGVALVSVGLIKRRRTTR